MQFFFFLVCLSYLYFLDLQMLCYRIFARPRLESFINRSAYFWARKIIAIAHLFLGVEIRDETAYSVRKGLPPRFIAISNHQSLLDIVVTYILYPKHQVRFVAKESLSHFFPGVSQVLRYQKHALIDRKGSARALFDKMMRFGAYCDSKGYCPVIFPEGTRSRSGDVGTFHPAGIRMIAENVKQPIVVAAMDGAHNLATLRDFRGRAEKPIRTKILATLPYPEDKSATLAVLARAKSLIEEQLRAWRG